MDYAATYLDLIVWFYASDMALHAYSDAVYLVLPNAKSCIAGCY